MSTISLRVPDDELKLFKDYAKLHDKSLSEIIRMTLIERIEDELDIQAIKEYEKEKAEGTLETCTHEEFWKGLGL